MDVNILVNQLQNGTIDNPPTVLTQRAAKAITKLAERVNHDQQVILNLQYQLNSLLEQSQPTAQEQSSEVPQTS